MNYTLYIALAAFIVLAPKVSPTTALPSRARIRRMNEQSQSTSISTTTIVGIVFCALSFFILISTFLCFGRVRNAMAWLCSDIRSALRSETRAIWTRLVDICRPPPAAAAARGRGHGRRPHVLPPIATAHSALRVAAGPRAPPYATATREARLPKPPHAHVSGSVGPTAAAQGRVEG